MSWQIDSAHTRIEFSARHMMVTNVRGEFEKFSGTVEFDESNPANSKIDVTIDAASIYTREERRDAHLRSADFLDVENYPTLHFVSKNIVATDPKHGRILGDLTIRGVTKEVTLDVEYTGSGKTPYGVTSAGFNAHTKINRTDWGLVWNVALETGGILVSENVNISLEVELIKVAETAAAVS